MTEQRAKYEDKFVAFIDILGFEQIVIRSAIADDVEVVVRLLDRFAPENDSAFYKIDGLEICPHSKKLSSDLDFRISQVSDSIIVSAEVSPAGAINIISYCRKVAERLLLHESVLCRGYLTRGQMFHEGMRFFGPAYQAAYQGEKSAAKIEWQDGTIGSPFIEIDPMVRSYLRIDGDECTSKMFSRMVITTGDLTLISPYGVFERLADSACSPAKSWEQGNAELLSARYTIDRIEERLMESKTSGSSAIEKVRIARCELSKARQRICEAAKDIDWLRQSYPKHF